MANILKKDRQLEVVHLLVEGNSLRSISRLTGVNLRTCLRILVKVGNACQTLLDERMRELPLRHVQVDEIWTYVAKKQARVSLTDPDATIGDQYVFIALDTDSKMIASYAIGKRTSDMARRFMMDLVGRLVLGNPFEYPTVQLSTDGFKPYWEAVDLAFRGNVLYGQIKKVFRNAIRPYTPSEIVASERRIIYGPDRSQERTICTSHVERSNLTIRTFIRRFTRLTLGFSKKLENLNAAVALHIAHYNFCRVHGTLGKTPTMAAGLVNDIWTLEELYDKAMT